MVVRNFQSSMWENNRVAILLLVIALTTVDFAENRRLFGGRRISSGSAYKKQVSHHHVNPVDLSYGSGHASAPKPTHTGGSHGYPSSGGLSGSNTGSSSHVYPSSGGLSGSNTGGSNHGYPSSGGLSGSNTGDSSHGYPPSNGLSGTNTGNYGSSHIQNTHVNSGLSGNNNNHAYPAGNGLSGHGTNNQPLPYSPSSYPNNHYQPNYHVNSINSAPYGGHPMPYPPYQGPPPVYVQHVQSSGSRFGDILTGLAIYNLAQSAANSFSSSKHKSSDNSNGKPNSVATASMTCILKIIGENKTEAVKVPCDIVSSFITSNSSVTNTTTVKTSNATTVPNAINVADNKMNSVLTNVTDLVNGATIYTTSTASMLSTNFTTSMPTATKRETTQNVSSNESFATNNSTVPNDPNKADNKIPQPTVNTINEGSESTTQMTFPETTPTTLVNMTVTVSQNVTHDHNNSESNAADPVTTIATAQLSTKTTTILLTNESTVLTTPSTLNENEKNSNNINNAVDPISVKGSSIEVKPDYECVIEVYNNRTVTSNKVPCVLLLQYAFQGTTTTVRPTPARRTSPNGSLSLFANSEKLSALCLVLFWVRYNFV